VLSLAKKRGREEEREREGSTRPYEMSREISLPLIVQNSLRSSELCKFVSKLGVVVVGVVVVVVIVCVKEREREGPPF